MIDDEACTTQYPEPVEDYYITNDGILGQEGRSTPLLATIHVVRSVQPMVRLFKSSHIASEAISQCEQHLLACMRLFPQALQLTSTESIEPRSIAPMVYLQNMRLLLHRHNLSPYCPPESRRRAVEACTSVAYDTHRLVSRSLGSPSTSTSRRDFAISATTLLCTHIWRCALFAIFSADYESALVLVWALSIVDSARSVTAHCGRNLLFFINCITDRMRSGVMSNPEHDEELMAYVSADMQSNIETSWIWQGSETGANLGKIAEDQEPGDKSHAPTRPSWPPFARAVSYEQSLAEDDVPRDWADWEQVERSLQYLREQHLRQRGLQRTTSQDYSPSHGTPSRSAHGSADLNRPGMLHAPSQQTQLTNPGNSRMNIANII